MDSWTLILTLGGLGLCAAGAAVVTGDVFFAAGAVCFAIAGVITARSPGR